MKNSKLLTIDIGTTSIKACLFSGNLDLLADTSQEYELSTSANGFVEMVPEGYWQALKACLSRLRKNSDFTAGDIEAVSISSQGETLVPVDENGNVLGRAIVWIDARAEAEAETLRSCIGRQKYYGITGMTDIWGTTPLSKLLWIRNNEPERYAQTDKFLLLSDYLVFRLTGNIVSERTMMSSTGYWDIFRNTLWEEGLNSAGIDPAKIPPVRDCRQIMGHLSPKAAEELGLSTCTAVVVGGNDQICGQIGAGNMAPGVVTETTGTALSLVTVLDRESIPREPVFDVYLHANGKYLALIYTKTAAIVLKWFKDSFCEKEQILSRQQGRSVYELLDEMAETVPPGCEGMIVYPHFEGKFAPDSIPSAAGMVYGLRLGSTRAYFIRAIMEGVAYMLREISTFLCDNAISVCQFISIGGGSKSDVWQQIKSDVLQKRFYTLKNREAASVGAAAAALVALGRSPSLEDACVRCAEYQKIYQPREAYRDVYNANYEKYRELDMFINAQRKEHPHE